MAAGRCWIFNASRSAAASQASETATPGVTARTSTPGLFCKACLTRVVFPAPRGPDTKHVKFCLFPLLSCRVAMTDSRGMKEEGSNTVSQVACFIRRFTRHTARLSLSLMKVTQVTVTPNRLSSPGTTGDHLTVTEAHFRIRTHMKRAECRKVKVRPITCPTHLEHCSGVVRVGSLCLNHPELVPKHPTHLARAVMVWFV